MRRPWRSIRRIQALEAELQHRHPDWQQRMAQWEEKGGDNPTHWSVVIPLRYQLSAGPQKYHVQPDGSLLACGYSPTGLDAAFQIETDHEIIRAFRLELLTHDDLPLRGPGRSYRGTAALSEFKVETVPAADPDNKKEVTIVHATSDIVLPPTKLHPNFGGSGSDEARLTGPPEFAIDGKNSTAWGIDVGPIRRNRPRKIVFVPEHPITHPGGTLLTVTLSQHHGHKNPQNQIWAGFGYRSPAIETPPPIRFPYRSAPSWRLHQRNERHRKSKLSFVIGEPPWMHGRRRMTRLTNSGRSIRRARQLNWYFNSDKSRGQRIFWSVAIFSNLSSQ